jgi:TRAP-type C4-dicarboxylate transport system permease large subunit
MISFLFMAVIFGWVSLKPGIAPRAEKATWKERFVVIPDALIVMAIFGVVIGGMITGFFSPTESGTIGTVAVFVLALVRREVNSGMILKSFKGALKTSIMVLMLIAGSNIFGHFLAITEIPMIAAKWASALHLSNTAIMDDLAFMVLATPIFFPTAVALGYDPIWFGILICVTLMIGGIIPPIAIYVFILGNITGLPFKTIYKGVVPFLSALVLALIILFVFPQIALWLPNLMMGKG